MKTFIIEDEDALARSLIVKLRRLRPEVEVVGWATNICDSIALLRQHPDINVIFADIKLDDGLSFNVFEQIETTAMVVFTTAYDEYALKAFDFNCADYLLKPIADEQLERALRKCEQNWQRISSAELAEMSTAVLKQTVQYRRRLLLEKGTDLIITDVNNISFVHTEKGYTRAFLTDGSWASTRASLIELSDSLDPGVFLRANRQTIININCIAKISSGIAREHILIMKSPWNDAKITVSADKKRELLSIL